MCNLPDYTDYTVIRRFTTCNLPVYERPLAEDTATFFISPLVQKVKYGLQLFAYKEQIAIYGFRL